MRDLIRDSGDGHAQEQRKDNDHPSIDTSHDHQDHTEQPPNSLFSLPPELREQIYQLVVLQVSVCVPSPNEYSGHSGEILAIQPAICSVNRQLRRETLGMFYSANLFIAFLLLDGFTVAKRWIDAIGDMNVALLRQMRFVGCTKVAFGHMMIRKQVSVTLDLQQGTMENVKHRGQRESVTRDVDELKETFKEMVKLRQGRPFDGEALKALLGNFEDVCISY